MSYTIRLRGEACPTCGHLAEPVLPSPTYNLTSIFNLAFGDVHDEAYQGLRVLDGRRAVDTLPALYSAIVRLEDPALEDAFIALEPLNGWGTHAGAKKVMRALYDAAKAHPSHRWEVM